LVLLTLALLTLGVFVLVHDGDLHCARRKGGARDSWTRLTPDTFELISEV
jgi:hypothetical protein